jgi:hypothetical protein
MQEPKIHSKITTWLDDDHWLQEWLEPWRGHPTAKRLHCAECGFTVYRDDEGTHLTWVETGWIWPDHPDEDHPEGYPHVGVFCIFCFGNLDGEVGLTPTDGWINPSIALNDDGTAQEPKQPFAVNHPPIPRRGGKKPEDNPDQ